MPAVACRRSQPHLPGTHASGAVLDVENRRVDPYASSVEQNHRISTATQVAGLVPAQFSSPSDSLAATDNLGSEADPIPDQRSGDEWWSNNLRGMSPP